MLIQISLTAVIVLTVYKIIDCIFKGGRYDNNSEYYMILAVVLSSVLIAIAIIAVWI